MNEQLKIQVYLCSETGNVRSHNEDRLCVLPAFDSATEAMEVSFGKTKGMLFAIADGMGGSNAGEIAAEIAIDTVRNNAEKIESILLRPNRIRNGLEKIIYKAHLNIKKELNEENAGMGTTLILALVTGNALYVAWCGDSRAYKYSPTIMECKNKYDLPHLKILTHDHSLVWDMVRNGELDSNAARKHELSNVITQSLGDPSNDPKPESAIYTFASGDKILVCSDGLNSMLPDEFIQELLAHDESIVQIGKSLIDAANAEGGHDNISVILAQIDEVPDTLVKSGMAIKERPEAITANYSIARTQLDKTNIAKGGTIKESVLILILTLTILSLLYFMVTSKRKNTVKLPDNQEEIHMIIPVNADSIKETINDILPIKLDDELGSNLDSTHRKMDEINE